MSVVIECQNQPNRRQLVALQILRFLLLGNDLEIVVRDVDETTGNVIHFLSIFRTTSVALPQDFSFFFNEIESLAFITCPSLTDLSPLCGMRKLKEIHLAGCFAFRVFPRGICRTTALNSLSFRYMTHFDYSLNRPILQNVEELDFGTGEDLEMAWPEIRGLRNLKTLSIQSTRQSLPSLSIGDLASIEALSLRCERVTDTEWLDFVLRKREPGLHRLYLRDCYNLLIPKDAILQCSEELCVFRCRGDNAYNIEGLYLEYHERFWCGDGHGYDDEDADYQELCSEEALRSHRLLRYVVDLNCAGAGDLLCEGNEMLLDDWYDVLSESSIDVLFFFLSRKPDLLKMS